MNRSSLFCFVLVGMTACGSSDRRYYANSGDAGASGDAAPGAVAPDGGAPDGAGAVTAGTKRVFVTSTIFDGNLGGIAGADEKCANAAKAAMLGGVWKAWMSSSSVDAIDRISDVGPWYLVDGKTRVFNDKANLLTAPLAPISLDERGHAWAGTGYYGVWSGSSEQGTRDTHSDFCADWTSDSGIDDATVGDPETTTQRWGGGGAPLDCTSESSLICFEQ